MNSKTGIVMEIKNKKACIMTSDGQFIEVKINDTLPSIGSTYTGQVYRKPNFYKYIASAACLVFFTSIGGAAYAYYTPTTSVVVDINPSLELKLNRWNKIIKTIPLNETGAQLASSIDIKNKDIDTGLTIILDEAEKEHFINEDNTKEEQHFSLNVTSSKDTSLALPKLQEKADSKKIDIKIDYSKNNAKNDIIKNGKEFKKEDENIDTNVKKAAPSKSNRNLKNNVIDKVDEPYRNPKSNSKDKVKDSNKDINSNLNNKKEKKIEIPRNDKEKYIPKPNNYNNENKNKSKNNRIDSKDTRNNYKDNKSKEHKDK